MGVKVCDYNGTRKQQTNTGDRQMNNEAIQALSENEYQDIFGGDTIAQCIAAADWEAARFDEMNEAAPEIEAPDCPW